MILMKELLNSLSSDNLVLLCVIMGIVALFLAIAISIEIYNNNKRYQILLEKEKTKEKNLSDTQTINIKPSDGIKYVEEDAELEKTKAKMELASIREKLKKEEKEKLKNIVKEEHQNNEKKDSQVVEPNEQEEVKDSQVVESNEQEEVKDSQVVESNEQEKINDEIQVVEFNDESEKDQNEVVELNTDNINDKDVEKNNKEDVFRLNIDDYLNNIVDMKKDSVTNYNYDYSISSDDVEEPKKDKEVVLFPDVKLDENVKEVEQEDKKLDVVSNDELDNKNNNDNKVNDDEENAIISYDELVHAQSFGYTDEEMDDYIDEKDAIISIQELEKMYKESSNISNDNIVVEEKPVVEFEMKSVKDLPKYKDDNSFQSSPLISPVYGMDKQDKELSLEQTANLEKLNEEIKKTNEFLKTLKDLKKNLE